MSGCAKMLYAIAFSGHGANVYVHWYRFVTSRTYMRRDVAKYIIEPNCFRQVMIRLPKHFRVTSGIGLYEVVVQIALLSEHRQCCILLHGPHLTPDHDRSPVWSYECERTSVSMHDTLQNGFVDSHPAPSGYDFTCFQSWVSSKNGFSWLRRSCCLLLSLKMLINAFTEAVLSGCLL